MARISIRGSSFVAAATRSSVGCIRNARSTRSSTVCVQALAGWCAAAGQNCVHCAGGQSVVMSVTMRMSFMLAAPSSEPISRWAPSVAQPHPTRNPRRSSASLGNHMVATS